MGNWHFKNIWMAKIYSDVIAIFRYARMFNIAKLFACSSHFMLWYVIAIFQYARIFVFLTDGRYTDLQQHYIALEQQYLQWIWPKPNIFLVLWSFVQEKVDP